MADEIGVRVRLRERKRFTADARKVREDIKAMGDESRKSDRSSKGLNAAIGDLSGVVKLVKPAALIAGVGALAQVAGAATVGVVGLVAGIAPAVGGLAALGNAGIAGAQSVGVLKLALAGVGDALGGLNEGMDLDKLALLTPEAQKFTTTLNGMKPAVVGLQRSAQRGFFPGAERGLRAIAPLLKTLKPIVNGTGVAIGDLAADAGKLFGGATWRSGIASMGGTNIKVINNLGHAGLNLATALMRVLVEAGPLTVWLSKMALGWSQSARAAAATGAKTGKLASFFDKTRVVLSHLFSIIGAVGSAFGGLMKAAFPVGSSLLAILDKNAEAMARWVNSATGQNAIAAYFEKMKPVILEVGRLARDVVKAFFDISNSDGALPLVTALRTKLLPTFVEVIKTTTDKLGPALTDLVVQFAQLIAITSGASGPLVLYVKVLTLAAKAAVWLLTTIPGLSQLVTVIAIGAAAWKIYTVAAAAASAAMFIYNNALLVTRAQLLAYNVQQAISTIRTKAATLVMTLQVVALNAINLATRLWAAGIAIARTAMLALNIALLANPIGVIIIAIVAIGAAFVLAYKKIGWFRDGVNAVWSWIKDHWPLLLSILTGPIGAAVIYIVRHWGQIKNAATSVYDFVKGKFEGLVSFFTGLPGRFLSAAKSIGSAIVHGIVDAIKAAPGIIKDALLSIVPKSLRGAVSKVAGAVGGIASGAKKGLSAITPGFLKADGGPIPGGPPFKDRVMGFLTPGEHVLTRADVAAAGGHAGVMNFRNNLHRPTAPRPRIRKESRTTVPEVGGDGRGLVLESNVRTVVELDGKQVAENTSKHASNAKARK